MSQQKRLPMLPSEVHDLRERCLREKVELSPRLSEIVASTETHSFLSNPGSQNIFIYLTKLVKVVSEAWFQQSASSLRILDWGCGKGHVTFLLGELGVPCVSCDIVTDSDDSAFGQATPIIDAAGIDVIGLEHEYKLPFADEEFDVVLSFGVLEHVPNDQASLHELARVLKNGGLFFCFDLPYFLSWTQQVMHLIGNHYHDRLYRKSVVERMLSEAGFDLLDMWHRQLLPKNDVRYPAYRRFEAVDQALTRRTPLRYFATNIEFIATKGLGPAAP